MQTPSVSAAALWPLYEPKLFTLLRRGYGVSDLRRDLVAGLTVSIVALPLSMALAIASGTTPDKGLYTAVVAGFLISLLGGSRVQIGGPTAAFIPIVFGIAAAHGYEGLATATVMAGVIVALMGFFRFGAMIKFIPYPVTTGFTSGIAVTILASQLQNFFGLRVFDQAGHAMTVPADFVPKLQLLADHARTLSWQATVIGGGSLATLVAM